MASFGASGGPQLSPSCPPVLPAQRGRSGRRGARSGSARLGLCPGRAGSRVAAGVRSRPGPAGLTPPGGVSGKSLKGARSSAPLALQKEPPRARLPLPPGASRGKCRPARPSRGPGRGGGRPGTAPRSGSSGPGCGRRAAPKFGEGLGAAQRRGGDGAGGGRLGPSGGGGPGAASGTRTGALCSAEPPPRARRTWRALPAVLASPGQAGAATPAPRLPSRRVRAALSPRGRAGSRRQVALGRRPSQPGPRRARAPGHPARPLGAAPLASSPAPAASYFHTSRCPGPGA